MKVTINNEEFGQISTKEVEVAKYLDMVQSVNLNRPEEEMTLLKIFNRANVRQSLVVFRNNQNVPTPLCKLINLLIDCEII